MGVVPVLSCPVLQATTPSFPLLRVRCRVYLEIWSPFFHLPWKGVRALCAAHISSLPLHARDGPRLKTRPHAQSTQPAQSCPGRDGRSATSEMSPDVIVTPELKSGPVPPRTFSLGIRWTPEIRPYPYCFNKRRARFSWNDTRGGRGFGATRGRPRSPLKSTPPTRTSSGVRRYPSASARIFARCRHRGRWGRWESTQGSSPGHGSTRFGRALPAFSARSWL